jgi:glyoxylase-like metal-dependent hydrolase (beta-lactamase superfamily II)
MSEADKRRLDDLEVLLQRDSIMQLRALAGMPLKQRHDEGFEKFDFPPSRLDLTTLQDGHEFRIGRYSLRCIATPGHSPGHMCLYDHDAGILFSGDHVLFSISPNIASWFESIDPLDDYLKSLELVGNLNVKHTFCAHRDTSGDCSSRVSELIKHHADRLDEVIGIVKSSESITAYDAASRMKWALSAVSWEDAPEQQKMFAVGEAISHLEYIYNKNMTRRSLIGGSYRYSY